MKIAAIIFGALVLVAACVGYGVWRGSQEPVANPAGPVEEGRGKLHAQLEEARKIESQAERQDWNSAADLRAMVKGHQQRIEKLAGNTEAAEILAYDRDAINRLQKRITELAAQQAADPEPSE